MRIKECVMHNLVADMIKTIIRNGFPVLTAANTDIQKQNIDEIKATIRKFNSQYNQDSELMWGAKQDLYTVFFQALPYMIEPKLKSPLLLVDDLVDSGITLQKTSILLKEKYGITNIKCCVAPMNHSFCRTIIHAFPCILFQKLSFLFFCVIL